MGGWSWDGDDLDPRAQLEADNGTRQARRLLELIKEALADSAAFTVRPETLCELNLLAVDGTVPNPGTLRTRDVEIAGSQHVPPGWQDVPALVETMCEQVNNSTADALHSAAFVLWRINWIHPFEEGNGRTARAVAYLVLCAQLGTELPGEMTLVERLVWHRGAYHSALEAADRAWKAEQLDVTEMATLLRHLIEAQLEG